MSVYIDEHLCPELRLKSLLDFSGKVEIDCNVSAKLYYKSGLNMFKQFNIYYKEGSWENALCIYLKYEKLFFDKIKQHPGYSKIPVNVKAINAANFRIIKPKAEHSKRELFKQYKRDYVSFVEEIKAHKTQNSANGVDGSYNGGASDKARNLANSLKEAYNKKNNASKETGSGNLRKLDFNVKSEASFETSRRITEHEMKVQQEQNRETAKSCTKKLAGKDKSGSNMVTTTASETAGRRTSSLKSPSLGSSTKS